MARFWSKPLLVIVASAGVVAALIWAGRWAREWLDRRGHFVVALADIQCPAPPGFDRTTFLSEVQYLGGLPDHFSAVDPTALLRVASAFAAHPWVEEVESVSLHPPDGPRARLQFRTPVLAVNGRAIDRHGILLPAAAPLSDLIAVRETVGVTNRPAGEPWGDPAIEAAARIAGLLLPFQARLGITQVRASREGLVFTGGITLRWGKVEGTEAKFGRLREILAEPGPLPATIDLTP
jgi:hypothetical protein